MVARQPITVRGATYASLMEAAQALGVAQSTVSRAIAADRAEALGLPPTSWRIRGKVYATQAEAAQALGCHVSTICLAVAEGREDSVMTGVHPAKWRPCRMNGRSFPSRTAAARALGVSRAAISAALRRGQTEVSARIGRRPRG